MTKWIGAVALATVLATIVLVGPGRIESVAATSVRSAVRAPQASSAGTRPTDVSARRRYDRYHHSGYRHYRYGYRPYYPRYYARPYYYEPNPYYGPALLPFGFGFGPWW